MPRISTNTELIDTIVARTMIVLDKEPEIVGDVYLQDSTLKMYVKKRIASFTPSDVFEFAIVPKKGSITHFISLYRTVNGINVSVNKLSNNVPVFKVTLNKDEDKYDMVNALYNRLSNYYYQDIERTAQEAIDSVFGD